MANEQPAPNSSYEGSVYDSSLESGSGHPPIGHPPTVVASPTGVAPGASAPGPTVVAPAETAAGAVAGEAGADLSLEAPAPEMVSSSPGATSSLSSGGAVAVPGVATDMPAAPAADQPGQPDLSPAPPAAPSDAADEPPKARRRLLSFGGGGKGGVRRLFIANGLIIAIVAVIGGVGFLISQHAKPQAADNQKAANYSTSSLPVKGLTDATQQLQVGTSGKLDINGQLQVGNGLILSPTGRPTNPVPGQIYFDKSNNTLYYYNGQGFVGLSAATASAAGAGSAAAGVASLGGATGAITLGGGLVLNGSQLSSVGNSSTSVTSLQGTANQISVSKSTGAITLSLPQDIGTGSTPTFSGLILTSLGQNGVLYGGGSGTIGAAATSTPGLCLQSDTDGTPIWGACAGGVLGTPGAIPMFTSATQLGDSIISQASGTVTVAGNLTVTSAGVITGSGSGITNLNASNINTGTLAVTYGGTGANNATDARTNLGAAGSGINTDITSLTALSSITPSTPLTIGSTGQPLYLQGSSSSTLSVSSGGFTTTLNFAQPTSTASILVPNTSGTFAVQAQGPIVLDNTGSLSCPTCLVDGSGGGGGVAGVVSVNSFSGDVFVLQGTGLNVTNNNGSITIAANQDISTTAAPTFAGLTVNGSLGVGTSPSYPIDVNGDINTNGAYLIDGNPICTSGGCTASGGSGNYIQNGTTVQTAAAFNIQGANTNTSVGVVKGATGQVADIFSVDNSVGTKLLTVAANGRVGVGAGTPNYPLDVNGDINTSGELRVQGTAVCADTSGCTPAPGSSNYVQNGTTTQTANFNIQSAAAGDVGAVVQGAASQTADILQVQDSGGTVLLGVTAGGTTYTGGYLAVNQASASYPLDVAGDANLSTGSVYRIDGVNICDSTGCISRGGSGSYIQNGTSVQTANFAIQSIASGDIGGLIKGAVGQTASLLQLQNSGGTAVFSVDPAGTAYTANSLGVGVSGGSYTIDSSGSISIDNASGGYWIDGVEVCSKTGCAASGGSGNYIQNQAASAQAANFFIQSAGAAGTPTGIIKAASGQTGDLLQFQSSGGSVVASLSQTGQLLVNGASAYNGALNVGTNTTSASGGVYFGTDTNLYRSAGGVLATSGKLQLQGATGTSGALNLLSGSAANGIYFGTADLYSSGAGLLTTDGAIQLQGATGTSGAINLLDGTTAANGIVFGTGGLSLYQSGTTTLTNNGNLTVTGTLTNTGNTLVKTATDSTNGLLVQNHAGTDVLSVDTLDGRVGINTTLPPSYALDVNGDVNTSSVYRIGGTTICSSSGCTPASGSTYYIQNGTSTQAANFNIQSNASTGTATAVIQQASGQTGDLLQFKDSSGVAQSAFSDTGTQLRLDSATSYAAALTIGTSSSTTAADGISFGGDTGLYRSAAGTISLQTNGGTARLQAAPASGTDLTGNNLNLAAGVGTGAGSSGNISFQTALPATTVNQSFVLTGPGTTPSSVAVNGSYIYWANFATNTIGRANLDGSGINNNFITGATGPRGVTVNGSYIYWTNYSNNTIGRANLDGTGANQSFIATTAGDYNVAVNGSYIYWASYSNKTIGRANLDGTGANQSFISTVSSADGVSVDNTYIYWAQANGTIGRANLDGTGANQSFITGGNNSIGVTVNSSYIYWTNYNSNTIGRSNLDGTGISQSYLSSANSPYGIAVDSAFIYWSNTSGGGPLGIGRVGIGSTSSGSLTTVASLAGLNGAATFQNAANSTAGFQVQNAAGTNLLTVDTTDGQLAVGPAAVPGNGVLTIGTSSTTTSAGGLFFGADTSADLYRTGAGALKTDAALTVAGALTASSTLAVTGTTTLTGALTVNNTVTVAATSTATSGPIIGSTLQETASPTSSSSANYYGSESLSTYSGTASTTGVIEGTYNLGQQSAGSGVNVAGVYGSYSQAKVNGAGTVGVLAGTFSIAGNAAASTGNVTSAIGLKTQVANNSTAGAVFSTAYGLDVLQPTASATGTIGTDYGVYIQAQAGTGVGTAYGLYQAGSSDLNYLAGQTGIGGTPANGVLTVGTSSTTTASGGLYFGTDTDLYRSGSAQLATNSSLQLQSATETTGALNLATGTTAANGIAFGTDTNLYRSAAGTLSLQGSGSSVTLQAAATSGTDATGTNLVVAAGAGTGAGSGGNLNLQVATPSGVNQNLIAGTSASMRTIVTDGTYLYWSSGTYIYRSNLDGSGATVFINPGSSSVGIAINSSYIYWTYQSTQNIGRANLDGSNVNNNFITGLTGSGSLRGIAASNSYIYWANIGTGIGRANASDGSGVNQSFISTPSAPGGVTIDSNYLYWTILNSSIMYRANLSDGSNDVSFISGGNGMRDIAVTGSYVYWANSGSNYIGRASLDGSSPNQTYLPANSPWGVMVNGSYIYWTNDSGGPGGLGSVGRTLLGSTSSNAPVTVASLSGSNGSALFKDASDSTTGFQVQNASGTSLFDVDTANGRVGIGNNAPGNLLSVGALTTASSGAQVAVSTGGTGNSGIVVQTVASQSSGYILQAQDSTGASLASIDYQGNLIVKNAVVNGSLTLNGHFISGGSAPAVAAGTAAGSGATASVSGNDTFGTVTVTTGSSPSATGALATITFNTAYGVAPKVVLSPSNAASSGAQYYKGTVGTTSFQIDVNAIPYGATSYTFDYFVGQ